MIRRWLKFFTVTIVCLGLFVQGLMAQPAPCTGDPDDAGFDPNSCPLDTWVFLLAAIAFIFAVAHLYKKDTRTRLNIKAR